MISQGYSVDIYWTVVLPRNNNNNNNNNDGVLWQNGDTALHIAAAMCRRKLTRILLSAGCSTLLRNKVTAT